MNIQVSVKNKIASLATPNVIVCGNSDYTITFVFDDEWSAEPVKTARFAYRRRGENKYEDVVFSGNKVNVPVLNNITEVLVGVYAGELRTTTPAIIGCEKSILCGDGVHEDPPEDVYNQLLDLVNSMVTQSGDHPFKTDNPHNVTAEQVGARPSNWMPTAEQVGADPVGSAAAVREDFKLHEENKKNPHGVTAAQVGARPSNWMPTASQVGARPSDWMPTAEQVGARPSSWMPSAEDVGARPNTWTPSAEEVGARPDTWTPSADDVGAMSITQVWSNASQGSEFAAQTVELDLADYDFVLVRVVTSTGSTVYKNELVPIKSSNSRNAIIHLVNFTSASTLVANYRTFSAQSTGVTFTDASQKSTSSSTESTTSNKCLVPVAIYAIKGGL